MMENCGIPDGYDSRVLYVRLQYAFRSQNALPLLTKNSARARNPMEAMQSTNDGLHRFLFIGIRPSSFENPARPPPMAPSTSPQRTQRTTCAPTARHLSPPLNAVVSNDRLLTKTRPAWRPRNVIHEALMKPSAPSGSYTAVYKHREEYDAICEHRV